MQAQNIKIDAFMKVYVTCHLREKEIKVRILLNPPSIL